MPKYMYMLTPCSIFLNVLFGFCLRVCYAHAHIHILCACNVQRDKRALLHRLRTSARGASARKLGSGSASSNSAMSHEHIIHHDHDQM